MRENGGLLSEGGITNEILYFFFSCKQGQVYNKGGGWNVRICAPQYRLLCNELNGLCSDSGANNLHFAPSGYVYSWEKNQNIYSVERDRDLRVSWIVWTFEVLSLILSQKLSIFSDFLHSICHVYKSCWPASWNPNLFLRMTGKVAHCK